VGGPKNKMRVNFSCASRLGAVVCFLLLAVASARADRVQVYSIQGADCATCGDKIRAELKKLDGVKKVDFDIHKVEITVHMDDSVTPSVTCDTSVPVAKEFASMVTRLALAALLHARRLPSNRRPPPPLR